MRAKYAMGDLKTFSLPLILPTPSPGKDIFTSAAVMQAMNFNYTSGGSIPERINGAAVSWQWFDVFWARPYVGRVFRPEEDQPGANHEAVLSYLTWKRRFGGDPSIVRPHASLESGVLPDRRSYGPDFNWPNRAELWIPLGLATNSYFDEKNRHNEYLFLQWPACALE